MYVLLTTLAVLAVLLISEYGWRRHWLDNEVGRKFVHVTVGSFVAFWPFYLSWNEIRLLSVAFMIVVIASRWLHIFKAVHSVQRPTYGEFYFAFTVGALTFITQSKGIYAAALLQMSLADGFAAIVGSKFGRENKYHIFGNTKSVAGTATFFVISLGLLIGYSLLGTAGLPIALAIGIAGVATAAENVAVFGLDNLVVPLFVGIVLAQI